MAIGKVTGIDWANVAKVSGISSANIANMAGIDVPAGLSGIEIADVRRFLSGNSSDWNSPTNSITQDAKFGLPSYSAGDTVVVFVATSDTLSTHNIGTPTGWTRITPKSGSFGNTTSDTDVGFFSRVMDGTEGTYIQWDVNIHGGFFSRSIGMSFTITGYSGNNQYTTPNISLGNNITITPITPTSDSIIITFISFDGADGDPFTMTNSGNVSYDSSENMDSTPDSGNTGVSAALFWGSLSSGVSTGSVTLQSSTSDGRIAGHILLNS